MSLQFCCLDGLIGWVYPRFSERELYQKEEEWAPLPTVLFQVDYVRWFHGVETIFYHTFKCYQHILHNPPLHKTLSTNVAIIFLGLISKHKFFNQNTIKVSYSCMSKTPQTCKGYDKKIRCTLHSPLMLQKIFLDWSVNIFQSFIDYINFWTKTQWRLVTVVCQRHPKHVKGTIKRLHVHHKATSHGW